MNIKFILAGLLGIATGYGLSTLPITDELIDNGKAKTIPSINDYAEQSDNDVIVENKPSNATLSSNVETEAQLRDVLADKDKQIARLQQELAALTDKIHSQAPHHSSNFHQAEGLGADKGDGEQLRVQAISFEQLLESAEAPYVSMLSTLEPEAKDLYSTLHSNVEENSQVERDFELEMKIQDFVTLHSLANEVELASVICKNGVCEAKGKELASYSWQRVMNSMLQTPWSRFLSSYSTADQIDDQGEFFYTLMKY
ncbi:hypothetical protein [Thalassotalea euphylliae]|uniref:Uncharacterized protein n=1 Tax=Thalassotalea euphylliae TaxID=1655234 RepID=A0A3E0UGV8_9GAMM|nr:hypothetical protein [Thalassotalea euphylliae]REL36238.1 hypothetical protein DXX92_13420 [Thalassotalea euphylliae]